MIQLKGTESSGVRGCLFGEKSNGLLGEVGFKLGLSASCWEDQGHMVFQNTEEQVLSSVSCRDEGSQHGGPPCGTGQGGKVGSRPQLGFYFKQDGKSQEGTQSLFTEPSSLRVLPPEARDTWDRNQLLSCLACPHS